MNGAASTRVYTYNGFDKVLTETLNGTVVAYRTYATDGALTSIRESGEIQ